MSNPIFAKSQDRLGGGGKVCHGDRDRAERTFPCTSTLQRPRSFRYVGDLCIIGWIRVDRPAAELHGENVDSVGLHLMRAILDFNDVLFGYQGSVWTRRGWEPRKMWVSVGNERGAFHGTHWKHRTAPASWELHGLGVSLGQQIFLRAKNITCECTRLELMNI